MIETPDIERPPRDLIEGLAHIGSATASGELSRLGIRDPHIRGPTAWNAGKTVVGPALTLQFMPKREDLHGGGEYTGPERQRHRHVLYHTQTNILPFAVNVPIACGNVLVMPGDIIVADDDGVVVVPIKLAPELLRKASEHHEWEDFSRMKLAEGGDLRRYCPLSEEAWSEYEAWKKVQK
jgi:regulator of RNase E activity RraA